MFCSWSFGCIAAELYLGLPLFPGITQHNQLQRIIKFIGGPPTGMLERGKNTKKFFKSQSNEQPQEQQQHCTSAWTTTSRFFR